MEFTTCCAQTNALRRNRYVSKLPKTYFSNHSKYLDSRSKTFYRNTMHYALPENKDNEYRSNNCCNTHIYKTKNSSMNLHSSETSSGYMYKIKTQCKCITR